MNSKLLISVALAGLIVFGCASILGLLFRNGTSALLQHLSELPGGPLPDALDQASRDRYTGITVLDGLLQTLVRFFYPVANGLHPSTSLLSLVFCGQVLPLHTLLVLEGMRNGNRSTVFWYTTLWTQVYQLVPVGVVAPIYTLLHVWRSPVSQQLRPGSFAQADSISDNPVRIRSDILSGYVLALVIGFVVPTVVAGWPGLIGLGDFSSHQGTLAFWQAFPTWVGLGLLVSSVAGILVRGRRASTASQDISCARFTYSTVLALTAAVHLTTMGFVLFPQQLQQLYPDLDVHDITLASVFVPMSVFHPHAIEHVIEGISTLLQYDMYCSTSAMLLWSLYQVYVAEKNVTAVTRATVKSALRFIVVGPAGAALWNVWDRDEMLAQTHFGGVRNEKKTD